MRYLSVFLLACGVSETPISDHTGLATQKHAVVDNVISLDTDALIAEDSVKLNANSRLRVQPGDFLVSAEGDGLLRRVTRVVGNKLETEQAKLSDVIVDCDIHETLALDPITFDAGGIINGGGATVSKLAMMVQPTIELRLLIEDHQVKKMTTTVHFERVTNVGGKVDANGPGTFSTGDVGIWSNKWRFVQYVGPVPIVEVVSVKVAGGLTGNVSAAASVSASASCSRTSTYSVGLVDGEWSTDEAGETHCTADQPEYGNVAFSGVLEPYLKGTLAVDFYGVAGPFLTLRDGLRAGLQICPAPGAIDLSMTPALSLGADLSKLGGPRFERTLVSRTFPIHSWPLNTSSLCQ